MEEIKKNFYEERIRYIEFKYSAYAERWKGMTDDRLLFCNVYNQVLTACESLKENNNNYVICAMINAMETEFALLDRIIERFKGE